MNIRTFGFIALSIAMVSTPELATAAVINSQSVIYLDSRDNIIGQSNIYCNQYTEHAGIVDQTNPYTVVERGSCDINKSPQMGIVVFQSATGKTVDYYCNQFHPGGTPFYGAPACKNSEPMHAIGLGPWNPGVM